MNLIDEYPIKFKGERLSPPIVADRCTQNSGYLWIFSNFIPACDGSTVNGCFDTKTSIKKCSEGVVWLLGTFLLQFTRWVCMLFLFCLSD